MTKLQFQYQLHLDIAFDSIFMTIKKIAPITKNTSEIRNIKIEVCIRIRKAFSVVGVYYY